jgi:hypothetical protein
MDLNSKAKQRRLIPSEDRWYQPRPDYKTPGPLLTCGVTGMYLTALIDVPWWNRSDPDNFVRPLVERPGADNVQGAIDRSCLTARFARYPAMVISWVDLGHLPYSANGRSCRLGSPPRVVW